MVWSAGQPLYGGRYVIERQLGAGGFGVTYLARDKKNSWVVIKTLRNDALTDPKFVKLLDKYQQDFRDEALRLSLCRHPHIVRIDNAFYEGQLPCIAMEYVQGENLWRRVNQLGILSETEALLYIRQIGEALSVIHEKGLLHRDVKPENIMVRAGKSEAVLIDFGIAREFLPGLTVTHTQSLTPGFAPIEQYAPQARRGEYTDIYALSATLYYLLTGQLPIPAPALATGIPLESPQSLNPSISNFVNHAILRGMEFRAEERPQSVQEWMVLLPSPNIAPFTPTPQVPGINSILKVSQASRSITAESSSQLSQQNSSVGIDYSKLWGLLSALKWKEADLETEVVMLEAADRTQEGWLRVEDIQKFPQSDLQIIDQLWSKHSKGRFGFSVQKQIWLSIGGTQQANYETLCHFGERVGWRSQDAWISYDQLIFDSEHAPTGHLPSGYVFCEVGWWVGLLNLFYRIG